ncbi:MAG TPA: hypothetical protein VGK73_33205 [Polyangiaceae bacterium]
MSGQSFLDYDNIPSALLSDGGLFTIPLWSVTQMSLGESYHLPPLGSVGARAISPVHDDTIQLTGVLVGLERYAWKLALEGLAESSKRGSPLAAYSGGAITGIILVTSMTIRTDLHVQSLSFTASASRRDTLDVSISMVHLPLPGGMAKLLDIASVGVGALADFGGN